ncbi:MAG: hypothetical protein ACE5EO_08850 [Candidatus Krumholzibacteriia bacterium]
MKKYMMLAIFPLLIAGCGKKHPVKVFVDPSIKEGSIEKIAVFPFASSLNHTDDPDDVAPRTMDLLFRGELDNRSDYKFMSPSSVAYALQGEGLGDEADRFVERWRKHAQVDSDFLVKLSKALRVEAVMIGVVDLWQRDEADYRENTTPTTYVGATVTILSTRDGAILFQASDEDYLEGARTETTDRSVSRTAAGSVRRDPGAKVYRAPEPKEVAIRVAKALASSLPVR